MSDFSIAALKNNVIVSDNANENLEVSYYNIVAAELLNCGFIVSPDDLRSFSLDRLTGVLNDVKSLIGSDRDFTPMYPGFPTSVKNKDTADLIAEQIFHYFTRGVYYPDDKKVKRTSLPIEDMLKTSRKLDVRDSKEYANESIKKLVTSTIAMSEDELNLLNGAVMNSDITLDDSVNIVDDAKNGENIVHFAIALSGLFHVNEISLALIPVIKNSNFLLRLILALYGVKPDASPDQHYLNALNLRDAAYRSVVLKNASKPVKRALVKRLGFITRGYKADSLVEKTNLWARVMRMIHPYDFVKNDGDTDVRRALDIIHNNIDYRTFNSQLEEAISDGDLVKAVDLLRENNPGALLRRLTTLVRISNEGNVSYIINALGDLKVNNLSTLVSARNGIRNVNSEDKILRVAGAKNAVLKNSHEKIDEVVLGSILDAIDNLIIDVLKEKEAPKGPVPVESRDIFPLVRRDSSVSDRAMDRGTFVKVPFEGEILRFFQNWKNDTKESGYVDMGVTILDKDYDYLDNVSWDTWSSSRKYATYSGDTLVYPGKEATEFFDIDVDKLLSKHPNARYIAVSLISYSGPRFNVLDVYAGVMTRTSDVDGELFDYRTVKTAFTPTVDSSLSVPLVLDLEKEEMLWIDTTTGSTHTGESSEGLIDEITLCVKSEANANKLTVGDIASMWAKAHNVSTVNEPAMKEEILNLL